LLRLLGQRLSVVRDSAGLSTYQLSRLLGFSQSKVSRMQTGNLRASMAEVSRWLDVCEIADRGQRDQVMRLAEAIVTGAAAYSDVQRGSLATRQRELLDIDAQARRIRQYHPVLITGPFHSTAYARACIEAANLHGLTDVDAAVAARLERGRRITAGQAGEYHVLLSEAALHWVPAAAPESAAETRRILLERSASSHVTVQVIPLTAHSTALTQCGFMIFEWRDQTEPAIVLVETPALELSFDDPAQVADFEETWRRLSAMALSPQESSELLASVRNRPKSRSGS
jgi:transcriptional regulator with XRE-family HTH domain